LILLGLPLRASSATTLPSPDSSPDSSPESPAIRLVLVKQIEKWKWRIRWAGRWTTTRIAYTEAEVRREHPEAVRIEASRVVVERPETEDEIQAAQNQRGSR
jgi:hypothetical protein